MGIIVKITDTTGSIYEEAYLKIEEYINSPSSIRAKIGIWKSYSDYLSNKMKLNGDEFFDFSVSAPSDFHSLYFSNAAILPAYKSIPINIYEVIKTFNPEYNWIVQEGGDEQIRIVASFLDFQNIDCTNAIDTFSQSEIIDMNINGLSEGKSVFNKETQTIWLFNEGGYYDTNKTYLQFLLND